MPRKRRYQIIDNNSIPNIGMEEKYAFYNVRAD